LQVEEFKKEVIIILGSEIKFDGHIEKVIENVDIERKQSILQWVKDYKQGTVRPEPCKRFMTLFLLLQRLYESLLLRQAPFDLIQ